MLAYDTNYALAPGIRPLALLHGFCEDSRIWTEGFWDLLEGIPVICMDLPGFGRSMSLPTTGMEVYAESVYATLQALGIAPCVLVGHSMGGYVALEVAARHPETLCGLGLAHSHPYADTPERVENRRRGVALLREGKQAQYVAQLFPALFRADWAAAHPDRLEDLMQKAVAYTPQAIAQALEGMMLRRDHSDTLRRFEQPVLIAAGRHDGLIPVSDLMEAAALPHFCMLEVLEEAAHMGMYECPEVLARTLRHFYGLCTAPANDAER